MVYRIYRVYILYRVVQLYLDFRVGRRTGCIVRVGCGSVVYRIYRLYMVYRVVQLYPNCRVGRRTGFIRVIPYLDSRVRSRSSVERGRLSDAQARQL